MAETFPRTSGSGLLRRVLTLRSGQDTRPRSKSSFNEGDMTTRMHRPRAASSPVTSMASEGGIPDIFVTIPCDDVIEESHGGEGYSSKSRKEKRSNKLRHKGVSFFTF